MSDASVITLDVPKKRACARNFRTTLDVIAFASMLTAVHTVVVMLLIIPSVASDAATAVGITALVILGSVLPMVAYLVASLLCRRLAGMQWLVLSAVTLSAVIFVGGVWSELLWPVKSQGRFGPWAGARSAVAWAIGGVYVAPAVLFIAVCAAIFTRFRREPPKDSTAVPMDKSAAV